MAETWSGRRRANVLASITQNAAALECCQDAGIASPPDISSLDLLRALVAFPTVDAVTAAAAAVVRVVAGFII